MTRSVLAVVVLLLARPAPAADPPVVSRIAFGSCAKQDRPQPIWDAVVDAQPQHFVFLGDNVYADTEDMAVMKEKYALLGKQPGYLKLKAACPVHATWDDHDYGKNDAGAEYPKRKESQQVFLDFFEAPKDDPRRSREGVYSSVVFGPPGKRVQLILLDVRYFRGPLKKGFKPGEPGEGRRGVYVPNTALFLGTVAISEKDFRSFPNCLSDLHWDQQGDLLECVIRAAGPIIRDIFGNPFRPAAFSLSWRTGTALARQMYDSRDSSAMPILADALQDAGCEDADILGDRRGRFSASLLQDRVR